MIYEFKNFDNLQEILNELKKQNTTKAGILLVNDSNNEIYNTCLKELPAKVRNFFIRNSVCCLKFLNNLPEPFFIKDQNSNWFYVNKAFCNFLDVDYSDIFGKTSHAIFSKKTAEVFMAQDQEVLKTQKPSVVEQIITKKNGQKVTVLSKKDYFLDVDNTPYIIGVFNEITTYRHAENLAHIEKERLENEVKKRTVLLSNTIDRLQAEIKQRQITEKALIYSEEKFRNIIEQSVEGIALSDNMGRIIEWNKSMCDITGISEEQAIGKYHWDIEFQLMPPERKTPEYYKLLKQNSQKILEEKEISPDKQNIDGVIVTTKGEKKYIHLTLFIIKTQDSFYIGRIVRDVTAQRQAIIDLERSEAQYRAIFENSSEAILIINPANNKIIASNEKAAEIYQYPLEELNGMDYTCLCVDKEYDEKLIQYALKNKILKNAETIHVNKKNQKINILINSSVIEYYGVTAIMNLNRDITELKKSEKARDIIFKISQLLHTSSDIENLYKSIHYYVNELLPAKNFYIALYDEDNDFIEFPYYVDEYDKKPKPRRLSRGLTEYVLRHGKPLLVTPTSLKHLQMSGEVEIIGTLPYKWLGVPLITQDKVIGVVAVQSYDENINYTAYEKDLLNFVSEQIAALIFKKNSEVQLLKAKEKAEESDRLKTSLIANMNHELRTPMTGILGFASLLKNRLKDETSLSMLDNIIESGNKLMATLNSILQLSQFEASRKKLDIINTDINKFVELAVAANEAEATKKGLTIIRNYHNQVIASFNENYLIEVVKNLMVNAITFTEKGSISITTGYIQKDETNYAFISVSDTGIGISKENYEMIFEEFRQVSEGINRKYEGSGLGLSLSKKMVEMMNGKITVESKLGVGSVFTVILPTIIPSNYDEISYLKKKSLKGKSRSKHKILVVDDNKINGELINAYLKNTYEVDIATTGLLAVELVKRSDYDVILMDINLGEGMTGIQTAEEIKKINDRIPIIAMTAYSTEHEIEQIMEKYFASFVIKPIDKTSLFKVISSFIKKPENNQ